VRITPIKIGELHSYISDILKRKKKRLLFAMNIHIFCQLYKNFSFNQKHKNVDVIFTDGVPLLWLSKLFKVSLPERVSGTDLVEWIFKTKKNIFLIGPSEGIVNILESKFPGTICGYYCPPFCSSWTNLVDLKIVNAINKSKASTLLVGVGPLKQERWLINNFNKTHAILGIGVGSAFDILSGKTSRAPRVLRDNGFEWLWRILLEPKRLIGRYLDDMKIMGVILCTYFTRSKR